MSFAENWLRRPQTTGLRKAVFQIHLWSGICLGLYVVVVCASGSAVVFRTDLYDVFESWSKAGPGGLQRHLMAAGYHAMKWLGDLHGSLLMGPSGFIVNAIGGFLLSALCLTGLVVWWPGIANWRRGLTIRRGAGWKRLVFDLHSAAGIWTLAFLFMWGMTGGYFVFPDPFRATVNYFAPVNPPRPPQRAAAGASAPAPPMPRTGRQRRPLTTGGKILRGFSAAHYGTFGGWPVKTLWFLVGLVPLVLVATSLLMWWNRVLNPALRRWRRRELNRVPAAVALERE
jgi:uncharacterized iron-regulated membrane protein